MLAPEVAVQPGSRAASRQSQYGETEAAEAADTGGGESNMAAAEVAQHGGDAVNHKSDTDEPEDSNDEETTPRPRTVLGGGGAGGGGAGGYWGANSRPASPGGADLSDISSLPLPLQTTPRPRTVLGGGGAGGGGAGGYWGANSRPASPGGADLSDISSLPLPLQTTPRPRTVLCGGGAGGGGAGGYWGANSRPASPGGADLSDISSLPLPLQTTPRPRTVLCGGGAGGGGAGGYWGANSRPASPGGADLSDISSLPLPLQTTPRPRTVLCGGGAGGGGAGGYWGANSRPASPGGADLSDISSLPLPLQTTPRPRTVFCGGGAGGGGAGGYWGANSRPASPGGADLSDISSLPLPLQTTPRPRTVLGGGGAGGGGAGGYWGANSRPASPGGADLSDISSVMPSRPKSRAEQSTSAKYNNLNYWRARKVTFYKNGDPYFPGLEFRFKPGRDVTSLEGLLDKLSLRMDLPRGARFIFTMDGLRIISLDELDDGGYFVVSSYKTFKNASYGKKNGTWYAGPSAPPAASPGWAKPLSRKASLVESEAPPPGGGAGMAPHKPNSGRVIRIINHMDHTVQCRVLLNLRTTQPFEEVLEDLGQVLKMNGAKRMYTVSGQEVRSFSQLRNEFSDVDTFYLGTGHVGSPVRRSRSRGALVAPLGDLPNHLPNGETKRRSRSKSRPRALYDTEVVRGSDYTLLEVLKEEPIRVTIRGQRRTFYPPLHHPPPDNSPPDKRMVLDWVYGYRGADSRRNLWVLPTGELLYYVAAVAVLYDRDEATQRHYTGHTEDIQCMDLHPSREMVGSGQRAGRNRKTQAHIRIWSTETLLTLYVFGMGEFEVGVSAVAFSQLNGGSYVLAVDAGRERILSVWQWQWGHLLGKVATLQDDLTGAAFHPLDDNLLITHGKGHLTFWTRRKDGFFERTDIIKPPSRTQITCLQFEQDGDVVTADSDGFVTVYSVDSDGAYFVRMEFEAHNKGIGSLVMLSEGTLLSGGEKDRKIIAWDSLQNYKKITETKLVESAGGVRTIYPQRPGRNDGNIYVGTTRNHILEGSLQRRFNQVVFGHSRQLWGVAVHPDDELFATAGHDKNIALWRKHKPVWTSQVAFECVSLSFHPFGVALAAGSTEGHLVVLNAETGATVATVRVCGSPLSCLGYNPAGDMVAIGSQNGSVYLFRVSSSGYSYKKSNKIRGSQPLTQLDWSTDGSFLQTVTADYDLTFWDLKNLAVEKSAVAMKDVKWHTHNATVGFLVSGIWNNRYYPQTSMITTVNRSAAHDLLVSGDAEGYIRLFRYPCLSPKAEYNEEKVYSLVVAAARFLFNDRNVVTVGGTDAALMLWELVDD